MKVVKTKRIRTGDEKAKQRLVMVGFLAGIFVILVLVAILFAIIEGRKSVTLDILVTPGDAVITLNGEKYKNGEYHVEPGEYEINIAHAELEPYSKVVNFEDGEDVKLYLYLTGANGDMSWYLTHPDDDMLLNTIGDYYAKEKSEKYVASDPVFAVTPHYDYNNGFRINAIWEENEPTPEIIVYLYTCDENRVDTLKNNANQWLEGQGIDLGAYSLVYKYCE